jgi:hypothetical protein
VHASVEPTGDGSALEVNRVFPFDCRSLSRDDAGSTPDTTSVFHSARPISVQLSTPGAPFSLAPYQGFDWFSKIGQQVDLALSKGQPPVTTWRE